MSLINKEKTMEEIPVDVCDGFEATGIIGKMPTVKAIPLEKVKQAREKIWKKVKEVVRRYKGGENMKAYELAWKLLKNGPFCEVELYGAIDNKSIEVRDIRYVGKRCIMRDGKYVDAKGVTRVAGFGKEVDIYGEVEG